MSRLCLDTAAYSHFQRGEQPVVDYIDSAEWLGVPTVVLGELWTGFLGGGRLEENAALLRLFLRNSIVEVLPVDESDARLYGEIVVRLREIGKPLPTNDIWIAAAAARAGR